MSGSISHVLTLVLKEKDVGGFDRLLGHLPSDKFEILAENKAIDVFGSETMLSALAQDLSKSEIIFDHCLQANSNRLKKLLICDMDSTLIGQECINELADYAGVKDHVAEITERAMRGEIGFDGALRERVGLLKGLPLSVLQDCFDTRISLNDGAQSARR